MTFDFCLPLIKKTNFIVLNIKNNNGKIYSFKTPLLIDKNEWDPTKQQPYNIYLKRNKKINRCLNRLRIELKVFLQKIKTKSDIVPTKSITNLINKVCNSFDNYKKNSFLDYVYTYIKSRKHLISNSTYQRYYVFLKLLERYEASKMKYLMVNDIKNSFVSDFIKFGETEKYNISTLYRTINFVKTILNFLEKRGIRTFVYELELPKEKKRKSIIILNENELEKIKAHGLLKTVKNWLLISCYTGQRISDFMNFCEETIQSIKGKDYLSFVQQKTQKDILIPIHPEINNILNENNFSFPDKLSLNTYNKQIKKIAKLAGLDDLVYCNKRNGFRSVLVQIPKWQAISSHIGRRSFASNFFGKIPTPLLMEATGHSSEAMFQRYVNTTDFTRARSLGHYFEQTYKK